MSIIDFDSMNKLFKNYDIVLSRECYDKLNKFSEILLEYNKVMNLTAITDPMGISEKHILDSLAIFRFCAIPENAKVIDVGTGAGFPGVPMKIYRPEIDMTLLDSLLKRIKFLEKAAGEIYPMTCIHSRAEELGVNAEHRERYDAAVSRAVAALPVLAEYCLPFVKVGGIFAAMKGPNENISDAANAIKLLGGEFEDVFEYSLPMGDKRVIAVIRKISATPPKYPRKSSQIMKKHL